jgi:hypothetical protein
MIKGIERDNSNVIAAWFEGITHHSDTINWIEMMP